MSDLIQKAIDQTERSQFGLCCAEAVHALDIANERIKELQAQLDAVKQGIRAYLDGDAITTAKAEQCPHGLYGYEDCGQCVDEYFEGLFKSERITLLVKENTELQSRIEAVQLEVDNIDDAFAHPDSTSAEAYRNIRQIVSALREAIR